MTTPNRLTPADFDGWVQERGLYFPNEWDNAFTPLFSANDPGEAPLRGGLLVAKYGQGYYVYTGLAFFRQLPDELQEAAFIDGAGYFTVFLRVMLPLVRPAIATVVVFRFVPIWNDFLMPLVMLRSPQNYTLGVGLTQFFGEYQTDWASLFAGLVIATAPLVLLFVLATKQIVQGLTAGIGK